MSKRFVPDDRFDQKLKTLFNSDKTIIQIAKRLKISKRILYREIHRLNLKRLPRTRYKFISAYKILELKKAGLSYSKIATQLNIHPSTLLYKRRNLGIFNSESYDALRYKKSVRKYQKPQFFIDSSSCLTKYTKEIKKLLLLGIPKITIARKLNVSLSTLWRFLYLKKMNTPALHKLDGRDEEITKLFNEGVTFEKMATKFQCHTDTIARRIKKLGLVRAKYHPKSSLDGHTDQIIKLSHDGFNYRQIAEIFGVDHSTMGQKMRSMNLPTGPKFARCDSAVYGKTKQLLELRAQGLTFREIGKILGVKDNALSARYRRLMKSGFIKKE